MPRSIAPPNALLLALALLTLGCADEGRGTQKRLPNVVLITLDTVRADHLTCYGATTGGTPAIDELAREGTLFERAVSSSGLTPSSHATILTGKFQYDHGVRVLAAGSGYRLDRSEPTLATALSRAGYRTAAVHSAFPVSSHFGFDQGFDHFDSFDAALERDDGSQKASWDVGSYQRRSDETTDRTLAWLDGDEGGDAPFFLWVHYWDPHDPLKLPPADELQPLVNDRFLSTIRDEQARRYAAEVRWQDRQLGRLLGGIRARGHMENTIVAVTADHGQGLDDGAALHGWWMHRMLYREQVHVPLVLRGPGVPVGVRLHDQVRTADVTPTLLDLIGLEPLAGERDGMSLLPRMRGVESGHLVAYGEQINAFDHNAGMRRRRPDAAFLYMVSDGTWKLIHRPHMPQASELFHVATDPEERENVLDEHRDEAVRLLTDLAERNPWVLDPFAEHTGAPDPSQGLEALGYSSAGLTGTAEWTWTCPEHTDHRTAERGRHEACGRVLVPVGEWRDG